ncbi:MAG: heme-binding protein, partial [Proteobacteria bacterium]|nr:heme-binding protein [Pseudomonadota bacterium]
MLTRSHFSVLVVLAAMMSITAAAAQTTTFERKIVTSDAARRIVDACVADAADWTASIAVAVVDPFGILIDFHSMQGASETSGTTALLKAKTAARWRRTTATVNQMVTSGANQAP